MATKQIMVAGRGMCLSNRSVWLFIFRCLLEPLPLLFFASCLLALVWAISAIEISWGSNPLIRVSHWDYHPGQPRLLSLPLQLAVVEPVFSILSWIFLPLSDVHAQLWNDSRHDVSNWTSHPWDNLVFWAEDDFYLDHFPGLILHPSQPESTSVKAKKSNISIKRKWGLSWRLPTVSLQCNANCWKLLIILTRAVLLRCLTLVDF